MKKRTRAFFAFSFSLLAVLLFAESRLPALALSVDRVVGAPLRTRLSTLSSLFSFSLAEWCLLLAPLAFLLLLCFAILMAQSARATLLLANGLLCFLLSLFAVYVLAFAPGNHRAPLTEALQLSKTPPTADEVLSSVSWLAALAEGEVAYPGDEAIEGNLRTALAAAGKRYGFTANTAVAVKESATPLFLRLGYFGLYAFPLDRKSVV